MLTQFADSQDLRPLVYQDDARGDDKRRGESAQTVTRHRGHPLQLQHGLFAGVDAPSGVLQ